MSTATLLAEAKKLPPNERVELLSKIWQSLYEDDAPIELTPDQTLLLRQREDRIDQDGVTGDDWQTVRSRLERERKA